MRQRGARAAGMEAIVVGATGNLSISGTMRGEEHGTQIINGETVVLITMLVPTIREIAVTRSGAGVATDPGHLLGGNEDLRKTRSRAKTPFLHGT